MVSTLFVFGGAYLAVLGVVIFVMLFGPNPVFQVCAVCYARAFHLCLLILLACIAAGLRS